MQRPGLLLMGGRVYLAFGAYCDINPYRGYVVSVGTTAPGVVSMWSDESGAGADANSEAGIWQSGGGLVSDGPGQILLTTGNGISPPPGPGSPVPGTLAESVVRLGVDGTGRIAPSDFFSPANAPTLDQNDTDLGSGGPIGLPAAFGTTAHPHLLVQVGKDGRVFLLDRDHLGGRKQGAGGGDAVLGVSGPFAGVWGHPAAYGGSGGWVYTVENSGPLRALRFGVDGSGNPALSSAATSSGTFGYTSGSPVVTSDGTTPGSALVWAVFRTGSTGSGASLRAYQAVPTGTVLQQVWSAPIGVAAKFSVPATDGGRVYVGTRDGHLLAFGRPGTAALQGQPVDFGRVPVGQQRTATATFTATRDVTVQSASATAPFSTQPPALPVTLHAGDVFTVAVSVAPTGPGDVTGQLTLGTDSGPVAVDLHAYGGQPGLFASPTGLDFGTLAVGGGGKTLAVSISNSGGRKATITGVTLPGAPFTVSGAPATGAVLAPGASVTASVTYAPSAAGNDTGTLTVTSDRGAVTVALTGAAVSGSGHLTLTPARLRFGVVAVGSATTLTFDLSNTGNVPLTITKAKAPADVFSTASPLPEGLTLAPGAVVHQSVTFAPTAVATFTARYVIGSDDEQGTQFIALRGQGG